jgi:hypothetical protein
MRACQPHGLFFVFDEKPDFAALHDRRLVLADLVALRQVRIEVVLAREDRAVVDRSLDREPEADPVLDGGAVRDRQRARKRDIDRRSLGVRRRAEGGGRAGEHLALRPELRVGLDPDHDLPVVHSGVSVGTRWCQSVAFW